MRRRESGTGCGPRGRGSYPRTRAVPGIESGGTTTALRGARWTGWRNCQFPETRPGTEPQPRGGGESRGGAPEGERPTSLGAHAERRGLAGSALRRSASLGSRRGTREWASLGRAAPRERWSLFTHEKTKESEGATQ